MKRFIVSLLSIPLLVFVSIFGINRLTNNVSAQQPKQIEAAILTCGETHRPLLEVIAYTGSTRAPSISIGTNCAQALADLLKNGFKITMVSDNLFVYTLIKRVGPDRAWM